MRPEAISLTSTEPYVLFVELCPWSNPAKKIYQNHFFSRKNDHFWEYFQKYDIGHLVQNADENDLNPEYDVDIFEQCNYNFVFYSLDSVQFDHEITMEEMEQSRIDLAELVQETRPKLVCFLSTRAYLHFFKEKKRIVKNYGLLKRKINFNTDIKKKTAHKFAYVFIMPTMYKTAYHSLDNVDHHWEELKTIVNVLVYGETL